MHFLIASLLTILALFLTRVYGSVRILEGTNGILTTEKESSFFLTCEISSNTSTGSNDFFRRNGNALDGFESNVTTLITNSTTVYRVVLSKTSITLSDAGVYTCLTDSMSTNVTVNVINDNKFDQSYSFTEGKSLDLTCPVSSVLKSSVQWFKDGVLFDDNRTVLLDVGETKDGRLQLSSLQLSDRGYYMCTATWNIGKKSFSTLARVRERLAPLWPVIGILAEVLVLALIILFCKDNRKKKDSKSS